MEAGSGGISVGGGWGVRLMVLVWGRQGGQSDRSREPWDEQVDRCSREEVGGTRDCASVAAAVGVVKLSMLSIVYQLRREVAGAAERGGQRAAGQAQRQARAGGLAGDPEGLGEAGWAWLRGLSVDEYVVSDYPSLMVPKKPVQQGVKKGVAQVIKERCARFLRGDWEELYAEAPGNRRAMGEANEERVLRDAVQLVKVGNPCLRWAGCAVGGERDFLELWAWTDLCYGVEANLGFRLGGVDGSVMRFVKSTEGTQQGDPLGLHLAAPLQTVLERVQERHPAVVISAYLDDAFFMGPPMVVAYGLLIRRAVGWAGGARLLAGV
eukprot:gene4335-biopygen4273